MDFSSQILDQVLNQAVKYPNLYGPVGAVPLMIRTPAGAYKNYGSTHSQSLEDIFASVHDLKIVYPYSCQDYFSLFVSCVNDLTSPTLFIENKSLYIKKGEVDLDLVYSPKMKTIQNGKDILCLSYGHAIDFIIEASKRSNCNPTIIDICSLKPLVGLDWLFEQIQNYNHVFIITESANYASIAEHLACKLYDNCFVSLRNSIKIISSKDCVIPFSKQLEQKCLLSVDDIVEELSNVL